MRIVAFPLALLLALSGCGSSGDAADGKGDGTKKKGSAEGAADAAHGGDGEGPGVREDGTIVSAVSWAHGTFDEALAQAKKENKLVFVDVGAYWCPPCHELDEKVFVLPRVGKALDAGFVSLHIDAENDEGPELVERYHVQAYPTMLVLEPSGVEKGRLVDFHEPDAFLVALDELAKGENVLAKLEAAQAAAPDDVEKAYELGHAYALAAKREQAEGMFDKVLAADPDNAKGFAARVLYDRAMFIAGKLDADPEKSIAGYRQLQEKFPDDPMALKAHRQIGRQLNKQGKADEAIASLDAMIAKKPNDVGLKSSYGWFCFRQKCNPKRGLEVLAQGITAEPDNAGLHYLSAELHHQLGQHDEALQSMRRAVALQPKRAYYRRQERRFADLQVKANPPR